MSAPEASGDDVSGLEELRALVREVLRDVLPGGLPVTETVNLSTDEDLAAFVKRLLDLDPDQREQLRSGRKRFKLATAQALPTPTPARMPPPGPSAGARAGAGVSPVRRIERGAVTEAMIKAAARAGERLVLGRGAVLTPLARDRARASGVPIEKEC
jgi:hypothetical protein